MVVLGVASIIFPLFASMSIALMVGWALFISGTLGLMQALHTRRWRGSRLTLLSALLSVVVGIRRRVTKLNRKNAPVIDKRRNETRRILSIQRTTDE
jgi:hypothetical protein